MCRLNRILLQSDGSEYTILLILIVAALLGFFLIWLFSQEGSGPARRHDPPRIYCPKCLRNARFESQADRECRHCGWVLGTDWRDAVRHVDEVVLLEVIDRMQHVRKNYLRRALQGTLIMIQRSHFDDWLEYPECLSNYLRIDAKRNIDSLRREPMGQAEHPHSAEAVLKHIIRSPVSDIPKRLELTKAQIAQATFDRYVALVISRPSAWAQPPAVGLGQQRMDRLARRKFRRSWRRTVM